MINNIFQFYLVIVLGVALVGCQTSTPESNSLNNPPVSREETQLVLNNAVLEQSNKRDNTVWKIKADNIVYSEDKQTADLEEVVANLLQDDQIILKLSANQGKIQENGNLITLQENIVASDPRNNSTIQSELLEWRPQENLLLIKQKLTGIRDNLEISALGGKYLTDKEILEVAGNVVANTNKPSLQLKSDRLIWDIISNRVTSPGAIDLVRYDRDEKITDRLVGDRGNVDLSTHTATIEGNVESISLEPNIQAASESIQWNYQQRIGTTDKPIQIINRDRQVTLTGNQGEINLLQQQAILKNGVRGIDLQQQAELFARELIWNMDRETIEATGNVIYQQTDPQVRLTGDKAIGTLGKNNITVTSNGKEQVTSIVNN